MAALTVLSLVLGLFFVLAPYNRGILGDQDGSRRTVQTSCEAPVTAVFSNGSRAVDAQGNWISSEAPCQRSAGFRLALGGFMLLGAAGLGIGAWRKSFDDA